MVVVLVIFSTIRLFFPPFNDDLGTMPTRRPYSWKKKSPRNTNETAVKVAGATAKHCIVLHGQSSFLSGHSNRSDFDKECYTRANVALSRATDLTVPAHRWSLMLPTSARVAQEVYEPLIGIQNPMLCSRLGDLANRYHLNPR